MTRVRISDIAKEAGVSPATVSRYLNNKPGSMSAETRQRIAEVIERTGYHPNSAARSLRTDRSNVFGVILADIRNPFSSAMLESLSTRAAKDGFSLMTAVSSNDPQAEAEAIDRLVNAGVDGLIVNTCGGNDELIAETNRHIPTVLLDRDTADSSVDLVTSNNAELVTLLMDELVACGCCRCYLITEHSDTSSIRRERSIQFTHELEERGLDGAVFAVDYDTATAAQQLIDLLDSSAGIKPIGLLAINGLVFLRLIEAINASGIQVPEQARLATFDDYAWNRLLFGGVTTAAQDTQGIADAIVRQLIERCEAESTGSDLAGQRTRIEIPGSIIRRPSTAA